MFWVPQDHLAPLVGMLQQAPNIVLGPSPSSTYRNTDASEVEIPAALPGDKRVPGLDCAAIGGRAGEKLCWGGRVKIESF